MPHRYIGLPVEPFRSLFHLDDDELVARGMRRMAVDAKPGFPCRITLEDAEPGERVLLVPFEHHPAHSPYRASGPIFVREAAREAFDEIGDPPSVLRDRILSVRGYASDGMMIDADVTPGDGLVTLLDRLFGSSAIAYAHVHFARRGCFAARVERAG